MSGKPVTPQDYFDLMQKMVNPSGHSFQSLMFPTLDPKELDRKISELETVEHWLKANLGMLQLSIKTLQYQKALMTPTEERKGQPEPTAPEEAMMNPAMWAWQLMNQAGEQMKAAADQAASVAQAAVQQPEKPPKARASRRSKSP
jgi:hypothetical protein